MGGPVQGSPVQGSQLMGESLVIYSLFFKKALQLITVSCSRSHTTISHFFEYDHIYQLLSSH